MKSQSELFGTRLLSLSITVLNVERISSSVLFSDEYSGLSVRQWVDSWFVPLFVYDQGSCHELLCTSHFYQNVLLWKA